MEGVISEPCYKGTIQTKKESTIVFYNGTLGKWNFTTEL